MSMKAISMVLILLATAFFVSVPSHAATSGMHIEGPTYVAINSTATYKVSISVDFDYYKCTLLMGGQNLTEAQPINQIVLNSSSGNFVFNVKMPNTPQRVYLDFKAYGIMNTTHTMKIFERQIYVDVKKSYTVIGEIKNTEKYPVTNVTVDFYIDGHFIGNSTVEKIEPNSTATVKYEWVPSVGNGPHNIEMKVKSPGVMFPNGKQSYAREIYIGKPPNYDWVEYLGIASAVALGVLFFFLYMGRKRGHKAEPKWKKS